MATREEIEERREKILELQAMGYTQYHIMKQLHINRMTMSRDQRAINESTKKSLFGLAKNETFSTYFHNCLQGVRKVRKECWKTYRNDDNNPEINQKIKMSALNLLKKTYESESYMLANGAGFMELERLQKEIKDIKDKTFDKNGHFIRHLTDEELDNLNKP